MSRAYFSWSRSAQSAARLRSTLREIRPLDVKAIRADEKKLREVRQQDATAQTQPSGT